MYKNDGILTVQYKTPVAFNRLNNRPANKIYTDTKHIFAYSDSPPTGDNYNTVIITDEEGYQTDSQYHA